MEYIRAMTPYFTNANCLETVQTWRVCQSLWVSRLFTTLPSWV